MRALAQACLIVIGAYFALAYVQPLLFLVAWYFLPLLCIPVLWYVVFDRHRDDGREELLLELQMLRNAIQALAAKSESEPLIR